LDQSNGGDAVFIGGK